VISHPHSFPTRRYSDLITYNIRTVPNSRGNVNPTCKLVNREEYRRWLTPMDTCICPNSCTIKTAGALILISIIIDVCSSSDPCVSNSPQTTLSYWLFNHRQ